MRRLTSLAILSATVLAGCQSIGMPKLSEVAAPFRSDVEDIPRSPRLSEAPVRPTDDRSSAAWDNAARELIAERDQLAPPADPNAPTSAQIEADIEALKREVAAYQAEDPASGPTPTPPTPQPFVLPKRAGR